MLTRLAGVIVLVILNAFFVGAEFALVRSRRTRLEAMARGGDPLARIALKAADNMGATLSASQLGVTLCGLGLGWVAESTMVSAFAATTATWPIPLEAATRVGVATVMALAVVTYLTVVFGELAPKTAALNNPERWAKFLVPPLLVFSWIARPFTWLLSKSATFVTKAFGGHTVGFEEAVHSPEEIRMLVEQSHEVGAMQQEDAAMLDAVFEFSEKNAREVMTPRTEIVALDVTATLDEITAIVSESGLSRFPVYEETIDDIIGVMLVKDLIPILAQRPEQFNLQSLLRPPHFVPGSREVEDVLADFKRRKEHMAIVLDEYGGTAGVVTMEDLLEEIVGEILDEYDDAEESTRTHAGETLVPGATNVSELNAEFGTSVPDDNYTTIGGVVFGTLGRVPIVGDRVGIDGAIFTVRAMEGRRIETLAMEVLPPGGNTPAVDATLATRGDQGA